MDEFKRMYFALKPSQKSAIVDLEERYSIPVIMKRKREQGKTQNMEKMTQGKIYPCQISKF